MTNHNDETQAALRERGVEKAMESRVDFPNTREEEVLRAEVRRLRAEVEGMREVVEAAKHLADPQATSGVPWDGWHDLMKALSRLERKP